MPTLQSASQYLDERAKLIAARDGFFHVLRTYLRPEQRPDAELLGDAIEMAARHISDEHFVVNPARGYAVILPEPSAGRAFRLSVLQVGSLLKVGVRGDLTNLSAEERTRLLRALGPDSPTVIQVLGTNESLVDWAYAVDDLYTNPLTYELSLYRISAVLEAALHVFKKVPNET